MPFAGFPPEGLRFLAAIARNNNREWFAKHKHEYEEFLLEPAMDFVVALHQKLRAWAPGVRADPRVNGSILRIYRDTRFSKDKTPYKTHFDMRFRQSAERGQGPSFYLYMTPKVLGLAAGWYGMDKPVLARFRKAVDDSKRGAALARAVAKVRAAGLRIYGEHYKRVPAGFDPGHPRADLLRHVGIYAGAEFPPPKEIHTATFPDWCDARLRRARPLQDWLLDFARE